jgi:hypothetical protein
MLYPMHLTRKQKAVLEGLFSGKLNVQEVLEKCKVKWRTYHRWHTQPFFAAEFKRLMTMAQSESELVLARYAADVAAKLVSLTAAEKEETARKACLDVISHPDRRAKNHVETKEQPIEDPLPDLTPELASKMLALMAEDKRARLRKKSEQTAQIS